MLKSCLAAFPFVLTIAFQAGIFAGEPSPGYVIPSGDGRTIQKAIDENPGKVLRLSQADYHINEPIVLRHDHTGLVGPGRIIQTNPQMAIVVLSRAEGVQLRNLILTRTAGTDGSYSGLVANFCRNVVIDNVKVLDNRAASSAINLDRCANGRISGCTVRNYSRVSIDDRTKSDNYGFAFRCFDGSGIQLTGCRQMLVENNRVLELLNVPTPEIKEKYGMGKYTKKNPIKGKLISQKAWERETFPQWHQGSAVVVTHPEESDQIQILGNYLENSAQGFDIHSDHAIVSQNIVNNAAVGIKAMHGSRNVLIMGNQFIKCDMHAILLQPGAASHAAGDSIPGRGVRGEVPANIDGGSIIANNIISDFGYGNANWLWGNERDVISLEPGQTPYNPPLTDVVVQGNVVYDPGRDKVIVDGQPVQAPPRYRYALLVSGDSSQIKGPRSVKIYGNIFRPGRAGVSNITLEPAFTNW